MDPTEELYCVRWKGFHSNIVSALEDLKTDESFVDVTLSCEGEMIQGHKVILSACSPYFKKILKDNPCRHPVLILNDIDIEVLDALMTYMYNGTVSVPQNKLPLFLKTAEALKIKGIVNTGTPDDSAVSDVSSSPLVSPGANHSPPATGFGLPPGMQDLLNIPLLNQHPAGDLSLLASAATEQANAQVDSVGLVTGGQHNNKRRKAAPRKLGSFHINTSNNAKELVETDEDNEVTSDRDTEKENNWKILQSIQKDHDANNAINKGNFLTNTNGKVTGAVNLTKEVICKEEKEGEDLTKKPQLGGELPSSTSSLSPAQLQLLSSSMLPTSAASPLNLLNVESSNTAADQMAALLGPDQMAALLGPSWKSRQPRMCQYCQRMFSNKFNLKQHILNMHTVGKELQCEICQKKVKNKWYLRRHHVTHHGAPLKK